MTNGARTFDPISAFQTARSRALGIEAQERDLDLQPQRNELSQLKLTGARQDIEGGKQKLDRSQLASSREDALLKSQFIIRSNEALKGLPLEQRTQAFRSLVPQMQQVGIDVSDIDLSQPFTDERLDQASLGAVALTEAFRGPGEAEESFTLKPGESRFRGGREIASVAPRQTQAKEPSAKELAETEKIKAETAQIRRKVAGGGAISPSDIKILEEEKKVTVKTNVKRIAELEQSSKARASSIKKAKQFKRQLASGERGSGTTRTVAGFFPGVFTDQAEFDQKFNAFAEVAARQQLKAAGEVRPTDADVEGMKRAMFGIGRDEPVNIQLLSEFISDQEDADEELDALRDAKSAGTLSEFVGITEVNDRLSADLEVKRSRLADLRARAGQ